MGSPTTIIAEIIDGVRSVDVDQGAKSKFLCLINAIAAAHGVTEVERATRVTFSIELIRLQVSRPTIRDRLIARFGVSRPQAYRIIGKALALSHPVRSSDTVKASNVPIDR
jgi:hypothetical protein